MYLKFITLSLFVLISFTLPRDDQVCLANSLIVGRDNMQDLFDWTCKVCDASNKPWHAHVIEEKQKDVKCIVTVYSSYIILAFRYTNTALNVWQDILYPLQINQDGTCKNCKVQKAYYNMWNNIKSDVLGDLTKMSKNTTISHLIITGISLGGGLSVISYLDIVSANIFPKIDITTFGAPRVGNKQWADYFDSVSKLSLRRYVVDADPIANMPSCLTILCSYKQTGIKFNCYETQQVCRRQTQSVSMISQFKSMIKIGTKITKTRDVNSIVDHVDGYPKIYNFTLIQ